MDEARFERSVESVLSRLLDGVEEDPNFDVEGFLAGHSAHAAECRARLEKLKAAGLLNVSSQAETAVLAGRYHLLRLVGRGGMGRVDRAADLRLGRLVAIKRMYSADERVISSDHRLVLRERFLREAKTTGLLEHPNIVPVHELGETEDGEPFLVMKLIEGQTLSELIADWRRDAACLASYSLRDRIELILRICDALSFAHSRGVVHRDLKPGNVMVGAFGELQVMDWGLAKVVGEPDEELAGLLGSGSPDLSASGEIFGTPSYLSPEQAEGRLGEIDVRTDVFGICAILYSLLALDAPYGRGSSPAILGRAVRADVAFDVLERNGTPRELVAILRRGMASDAGERYPTVAALKADCEAWLSDREGRAWRDGAWSRMVKWVRRHPSAAAVGAAALVVLAMGVFTGRKVRAARLERATAEAAARNLAIDETLEGLSAVELYRLSAEELTVLTRERERLAGGAADGEMMMTLPPREVVPRYEYAGMALDVLEQLEASPIAVLEGPEEVWLELLEEGGGLRPDHRSRILDVLYFLTYCLHGAGLTELFEYESGSSSLDPSREVLEAWEADRVRYVRLLERWPRIARLVRVEPDSDVRRVWTLFMEDVRRGTEALRVELDAGSFDENARALVLATRFLDARTDDREMVSRWKKVLEKRPDSFPALLALQSFFSSEKDWEEARVWGEAAKALIPESPWAWNELAFAYLGLGKTAEAERYALHVARMAPDPIILRRMALVLFRVHEGRGAPGESQLLEDAIAFERTALKQRPLSRWGDSNLALFLEKSGRFDELLVFARDSQVEFPGVPEPVVVEANALQKMGRTIDRDLAYLRETQRDSDVALFWAELGKVEAFRDHFEHAIPYLRRAVELIGSDDDQVSRFGLDQLTYEPARELGKAEWRLSAYLSGSVPVDDLRGLVWHADTAGFRGEYHRAVELYRELFVQWEESLDPVAWYESTGYDPFGFYRMALRWIVPAMDGEGYLFVPDRPLVFKPNFLSVSGDDGYGEPLLASERPTLATAPFYTDSYRAELRELFVESVAWMIEGLRMDQALASPVLTKEGLIITVETLLDEIPFERLYAEEEFLVEELRELAR